MNAARGKMRGMSADLIRKPGLKWNFQAKPAACRSLPDFPAGGVIGKISSSRTPQSHTSLPAQVIVFVSTNPRRPLCLPASRKPRSQLGDFAQRNSHVQMTTADQRFTSEQPSHICATSPTNHFSGTGHQPHRNSFFTRRAADLPAHRMT